jgi:type IV pilus assembly protein PilM
VKSAPQFQDNLASFAVVYGLAVQGLNRGGLSTSLLPPEIARVRLIRAKKPWALAASALILLGLTFLFTLGDYRALAKVTTHQFKTAVEQAKSVSKRGAELKSQFEAAKTTWNSKYEEGKALIVDPTERALWPSFLKKISNYWPEPEQEYQLNPDDPNVQDELEKLRVHIDAIKPVWRADLKTEWFDLLDSNFKKLMHPYDVANPPSGAGWVIQMVCHHYNPYPSLAQMKIPIDSKERIEFGPYQFITEKVLKKLSDPTLRLFGVKNVALAWLVPEKNWTSDKGSLSSNTVPLLDRASAPVGEAGGGGGMSGGGRMSEMMGAMMGGMGGGGAGQRGMMGGRMGGMGGGRMSEMMGGGGYGGMMMQGMMGGPAGKMTDAETKAKLKTLTRTDFLIQFVWVPVPLGEQPKTVEDFQTKVTELSKLMREAEKNNPAVTMPKPEEIEAASLKQSQQIDAALSKAVSAPGPGAAGGGAPGMVPPSAGAAPAPAGPAAGGTATPPKTETPPK